MTLMIKGVITGVAITLFLRANKEIKPYWAMVVLYWLMNAIGELL